MFNLWLCQLSNGRTEVKLITTLIHYIVLCGFVLFISGNGVYAFPKNPELPKDASWSFSGNKSELTILILDYKTLKLKTIYNQINPCRDDNVLLSDDSLKKKAISFVESIWPYWPRNQRINAIEYRNLIERKMDVENYENFVFFRIRPADFGGVFIYHACSGLLLFAGSIVHNGTGKQFYPADPLSLNYIYTRSDSSKKPTHTKVIVDNKLVNEQEGLFAFESVRQLNIVHDFAEYSYKAIIYLYAKRIGLFDPTYAEWVIVLYRK